MFSPPVCRLLLLNAVIPRASLSITFIKNKLNNALVHCYMFQVLLKFERQKHVSNNKALCHSYTKCSDIFVSFDKLRPVLRFA